MSQQETIDRSLRMALGDMHVQLILANAQIADLQEQVAKLTERLEVLAAPLVPKSPNGKHPQQTPPPPG